MSYNRRNRRNKAFYLKMTSFYTKVFVSGYLFGSETISVTFFTSIKLLYIVFLLLHLVLLPCKGECKIESRSFKLPNTMTWIFFSVFMRNSVMF